MSNEIEKQEEPTGSDGEAKVFAIGECKGKDKCRWRDFFLSEMCMTCGADDYPLMLSAEYN
jgi:hypothetical protein